MYDTHQNPTLSGDAEDPRNPGLREINHQERRKLEEMLEMMCPRNICSTRINARVNNSLIRGMRGGGCCDTSVLKFKRAQCVKTEEERLVTSLSRAKVNSNREGQRKRRWRDEVSKLLM